MKMLHLIPSIARHITQRILAWAGVAVEYMVAQAGEGIDGRGAWRRRTARWSSIWKSNGPLGTA